MTKNRVTPNPQSIILADAVVGGAGIRLPPNLVTPDGMGAVLLYVPTTQLAGKNVADIQKDLGLPWYAEGVVPGVWFDEDTPAGGGQATTK